MPNETTGTVTQGGVSATLLGVYPAMHDEQVYAGKDIPATGYLMVNNITGGTFTTGALTISGGLSARASGDQITDYREGLAAGVRQNSPRGNYSPWDGTHNIPTFQLVFPTNFMIDTYLYVYADPRIPAMVKKNLDVILTQIYPKEFGQPYFNVKGGTDITDNIAWGDHSFVKSYKLENPVSKLIAGADPSPFELAEYARMIAFVLKTSQVNDTVNGKTYTDWYESVVDTANVSPYLLTWMWKYFGQFYSWGMDAPWMMKQTSLLNYSPTTMRTPTQYNYTPGDMPEITKGFNRVNDHTAPTAPASVDVQ